MKKRVLMLLTALAVSVSLVACGGGAEETTQEATEAPVEETEEVVEEVSREGMYRSELTNEWISEDLKDQRPIAVMVDNEMYALPHYGLTQADVVYEIMNSTANGRITRFMVLYKDYESVEQIGSIRSVRPTNFLLAAEWNAIICHDGGPVYINEYLGENGVNNFSGTFSRVDNGKAREFTEYILPGDMEDNFNNSNVSKTYTDYYEGAHYQFASEENPVVLSESYDDTLEATLVDLPFAHNGSYLTYDEEAGVYNYFEYGEPHLDPGNDDAQLCFENLLIQSCGYEVYDDHGYMKFHCIGSGYGYYVTNGEAIYVSWEKESATSPTRYYDMQGNEITINTGKTYVAFVPVDDWNDLVIE